MPSKLPVQFWMVLLLACLIGVVLADRPREIAPSALPESVKVWLSRMFPEADIVRAEREEEERETTFDVRLKSRPDGRSIRVELEAERGVQEIEEEIDKADLPAAVAKAVERAFPKARLQGAQKRSEIRVIYKLEIEVEGKRRELRISPRGRILEVEKKD